LPLKPVALLSFALSEKRSEIHQHRILGVWTLECSLVIGNTKFC
jgi:hypothetical protein